MLRTVRRDPADVSIGADPAGARALRVLLLCLSVLLAAGPASAAAPLPEALRAALDGAGTGAANKPVYVDFWASWCVPCAQSFPWLNSVLHRYGREIVVIGVNVDERRADADRFLSRHPAEFALVFDPAGELAAHYRLRGMPSAVLLGAGGEVLWQHSGFRKEEIPEYEAAIKRALK
jgi:cytochrome c biogenesis protein CcmG, thiol:disulfide interchange protein DsbE